jgi:hypothetical protein
VRGLSGNWQSYRDGGFVQASLQLGDKMLEVQQ